MTSISAASSTKPRNSLPRAGRPSVASVFGCWKSAATSTRGRSKCADAFSSERPRGISSATGARSSASCARISATSFSNGYGSCSFCAIRWSNNERVPAGGRSSPEITCADSAPAGAAPVRARSVTDGAPPSPCGQNTHATSAARK
jgi:hypothetical protein